MTATLTPQEENDVLDAVKTAVDHVASGLAPTAAIVKIAKDRGYGAGMVRLLSHAFNTGQQNAQWQAPSRSILEKLATFDLADAESAIQTLYGEKQAVAPVSGDYARPPTWLPQEHPPDFSILNTTLKAASAAPAATGLQDHGIGRFERAFSRVQRAKHAADNAAVLKMQASQALHATVRGLVGYFKQASATRHNFEDFRLAAEEYFGDTGRHFCDLIASQSGCRDKAASAARTSQAVDWTANPFQQLRDAVNQTHRCLALTKEAADLANTVTQIDAEVRSSLFPAPGEPPVKQASLVKEIGAIATGDILAHHATHPSEKTKDQLEIEDLDDELAAIREQAADAEAAGKKRWKSAGLGTPAGTAIGAVLGRTLGSPVKTKDDLVDDAYMRLEDPHHTNELRKIRTQAMLSQMLNDPEDPISGHNPERVMQAYNEISETTPRLADTAATLRPLLRRRLEAHQEPFEVKEMLDTEKGIAATRGQHSLLSDNPGSPLR